MPRGTKQTREECLAALRRLSEILGGSRPTAADLRGKAGREAGCPREHVYYRLFGSLEAAVEAAGLSDLPTAKQKRLSEARAEVRRLFEEALAGRKFLLEGEAVALVRDLSGCGLPPDARKALLREVCREKGVRLVSLPASAALHAVASWLAGQPCRGRLPEREAVRAALGEEAARLLELALELGSLAAAARAAGCEVNEASKMVITSSRGAVRRLTGRVLVRRQ
ncbi:homing endonuclease associated repeat-containing protein [Desulfovirgula thermocuniculi]|uniref:homing endonuclease associated repeat-containing protein n=1 Tax=Desulfovirgula thermocuniculi TaxID=348842 RepID=UPI0004831EFE|nr:hypothetical protein [Desulfovirgula thermocuniculi]